MQSNKIITSKQCFSHIGMAFCLLAVVTIATQSVLIALLHVFAPQAFQQTAYSLIIAFVPMYAVGVPVCARLLHRVPRMPSQQSKMGIKDFCKWLIICFGVMYVGSFIGQICVAIVGSFVGHTLTNSTSELISQSSVLTNTVVIALIAPIVEELLFRKLLIDRVRPFGERVAILLSGVMFGLFHGNFYQFFYAAGVGMVFAYVYVRTSRIRYSIFMHMIINITGAVLLPALLTGMGNANTLQGAIFASFAMLLVGCVVIASIGVGLYLLNQERKKIVLQRGICPIAPGWHFTTIVLNGGMIAFLGMCLLEFLIETM